jgi:hypothetical protein
MAVLSFPGTGATLTFEWHPNPIVLAQNFFRGADFLEDLTLPLTMSKGPAIASMHRRFDTKTTPGGAAWAEWSDTYAPVAEGSLGELSGATRGSVTSPAAWLVTTNEMFLNMGVVPQQGIWFNDGTGPKHKALQDLAEWVAANKDIASAPEGGFGEQPARPFAGIDEEAQFEILEIFDAWVGQAANIILFGGGPRAGMAAWTNAKGQFTARPY